MKVRKCTVTITVEVLSVDAASHLIRKVADEIDREFTTGSVTADDGDTVTWDVGYGERVSIHSSL